MSDVPAIPVEPEEPTDEIEKAIRLLVETVDEVGRMRLGQRAPTAALLYRALKHLADRTQEIRNASILEWARAAADESRRQWNENLPEYPEHYEGDWLDEEETYEYVHPVDGKTYILPTLEVQRTFERHAQSAVRFRLGSLRFRIPVADGKGSYGSKWLSLDAFSTEGEPMRIAERERQKRVTWRKEKREREERAAARQAAREARQQ